MFNTLLKHLLDNAIKFSSQGTIHVSLSYENSSDEILFPHLLLTIKDEGIGIDPIYHSRIFDAFYQIDSTYKRSQGGTGMGLAVCKKIVDCVGGRININSALGKGTEFKVFYPIRID